MKNAYYGVPATQNFAFGGIANPTQQTVLRSDDRSYLDARQKELDEFEKQRTAYNDSLAKWQTEVYNPYKTQLDAYNAAAEKYNAGPRTEDFTLTAPAIPEDFTMAAPAVPFKEEEVQARQQEAAARATQDAGNRAVAIDVVSNPDKFNFGSMSVSNRFMAQGGEVRGAIDAENLSDEVPDEVINTDPVGTAQKMLADLGNLGKVSPVRQSIKRVRTAPGGGATADKAMQMPFEGLGRGDLGAMKDVTPTAKNTDSARAQMEELARVYQLKIRAAQNKGKGLSADTFGAPTLEGPTLTKNKLTKKRFKDGGEAKKSSAVADIGKWLKNNDINPSDFLTALGRVGSTAGAALTPGELNKGEDAELARRRAMPPTVDRAGGSPEGGETKKDEGPSVSNTTGVNRVLDFIAQRLPADSFPTSARTLLETVQGKKEPITESNFSPKELDVLRQLIESTGGRGNVQYADYIKFMRQQQQEKGTMPASIAPGPFSIIDPIGNVQTTLGRFAYSRDADGNLVVADSYDFNPIREMSGVYGALRNYAGEKVPPGKGREVKINLGKPVQRAGGSPEEGELSQEEIDAASRPAFVTPSSGKGRKQGKISKQLKSGDAYINMAKGVTEFPYDLVGAPVDLVTMAMRPFGYSTEKPVMGSDWIKQQMTDAKVRPEPPADPTAKGFYTAGELLSNLVNPAGVTRAGVKAAGKTGKAATEVAKDFQQYNRQLSVPGASYAVRPTGSTMLTGSRGLDNNVITVSAMDQLLANGMSNAPNVAGQNAGQAKLIAEFWDKKARNYFERQFGTPDDPIMEGIKAGRIKGETLSSDLQLGFPAHLIDSLSQGKMRYKEGARPEGFVGPGAPEGRFFPKYPEAVEDFTRRYDTATGLRGNFFTRDPVAADPNYDLLSQRGRDMAKDVADIEADKLIAQGVRPELINTGVGTVTRSVKDPKQIIGDGTSSAKKLYDAFEQAVAPGKTNEPGKTGLLNKIFGENKPAGATSETQVAADILPENVVTALQKNEPVYDIAYMDKRLRSLFNPASVNEYLATLPPRELANIRFEDAIRGGLKLTERTAALDNVAERIRTGKPVADAVFSNGVSAPLLQIKQGPLEGFAWKRIEKREATVPEGAYVGHSVGGYEVGGAGYTKEKREGFNTGRYQVYTLRDNRNRPVNTVEVQMLDENTPVVMQIKGNGRATGNVPAASYDNAVLDFFENYLRPAKIDERDEFLTPLLKKYKEGVNAGFKMP